MTHPARPLPWALCLCLALGLLHAGAAQAQVYKCHVAGKVLFQDKPCQSGDSGQQVAARKAGPLPWSGLERGMTVEQVLAVQPRLKPLGNESGKRLFNGAQARLYQPGVQLAGQTLQADYYFLGGTLYQIMLSLDIQDNSSTTKNFEQMEKALAALWGKPAKRELKDSHDGLYGKAEWHLPGGHSGQIVVVPITRGTSLMNVNHRLVPDN